MAGIRRFGKKSFFDVLIIIFLLISWESVAGGGSGISIFTKIHEFPLANRKRK